MPWLLLITLPYIYFLSIPKNSSFFLPFQFSILPRISLNILKNTYKMVLLTPHMSGATNMASFSKYHHQTSPRVLVEG